VPLFSNESSNSWKAGERLNFFADSQHRSCWEDVPRSADMPCCYVLDEIGGEVPDGKLKVLLDLTFNLLALFFESANSGPKSLANVQLQQTTSIFSSLNTSEWLKPLKPEVSHA
jgi:hypothetical protein